MLRFPGEHGLARRSGASLTTPRVLAALRLSFGSALAAALINAVFGLLVAWVLVRYGFPAGALARCAGRSALRPADRGGRHRADRALRAERLDRRACSRRSASRSPYTPARHRRRADVHRPAVRRAHGAAGAGGSGPRDRGGGRDSRRPPLADLLPRHRCPAMLPALLTGFALAFARAVGEYGSVIFIAGNMPMMSEIAPLLIVIKLEQFDYAGRHRHRRGDAGASSFAAAARHQSARRRWPVRRAPWPIAAQRPAPLIAALRRCRGWLCSCVLPLAGRVRAGVRQRRWALYLARYRRPRRAVGHPADLLVAAIAVPLNLVFGVAAAWASPSSSSAARAC